MDSPYGRNDISMDKGSRTLTAEQIRWAASEFLNGASLINVATALDTKPAALYHTMRRRGVRVTRSGGRRTLTSDTSCFSDPFGSEQAAYFIGFLMADGCVSERGCVTLALKESDRSVIDRLNEFLGGGYTVSRLKRIKEPGWNREDNARTTFQGGSIASDLASFGVVVRKTSRESFKRGIETNKHVWRGTIDGDGSLFFTKQFRFDYPQMTLCGSSSLLDQFTAFVRGVCPSWKGAVRKTGHGWLKQVSVTGRHAKELARVLYDGATVALPRKAALARQFMAWEPKRIRR